MRTIVCLAGVLLACCTSLVGARLTATRPGADAYFFPLFSAQLPSGLQLLVEQDRRSPIAGVVWAVDAGSTSDPPGKEGLAHLVEHLVFASRQGASKEAYNALAELGAGAVNGFTSFDATVYHAFGPSSVIRDLAAFEIRRIRDP